MLGKYQLFIYVCMASSAYAEDLTCQTGTKNECVKADLCPQFVKDREKSKSFARGSTLYKNLISRLKRHICNKVEKKICCNRTSLPSWLLSKIKGCGVSFDPSFFCKMKIAKILLTQMAVLPRRVSARATRSLIPHINRSRICWLHKYSHKILSNFSSSS